MQQTKLSKPNIFQLLVGIWITVTRDSKGFAVPTLPPEIHEYSLISEVKKERGSAYSFGLGQYQKNGRTYFIKRWTGKVHDLNYYALVNEYSINALLQQKMQEMKSTNIRVPTIVEYISETDSLTLIYEFIEGTPLTVFPVEQRTKILNDAIELLGAISASMSQADNASLGQRSLPFLMLSFIPLTMWILCANSAKAELIISNFMRALWQSLTINHKKLTYKLAHRDLDASNILLSSKAAYITDVESTVMTIGDYDLVRLTTTPDVGEISPRWREKLTLPENQFLRVYILFHLILSANPLPTIKEQYFTLLS